MAQTLVLPTDAASEEFGDDRLVDEPRDVLEARFVAGDFTEAGEFTSVASTSIADTNKPPWLCLYRTRRP